MFKIKSSQIYVLIKYSMILYFIYYFSTTNLVFGSTPPGGDSNDVIGESLCNLVNLISGQIARGIATLAIFAIGIGLFLGKVSWGLAATTAAAVAVIFGASDLVDFFAGDLDTGSCVNTA
ncbi:MAG: TrbC/VirB2 family protein [Rickettsia sp.]|nr:TrbC/VirB2 family protein [Rickettsia sp.]